MNMAAEHETRAELQRLAPADNLIPSPEARAAIQTLIRARIVNEYCSLQLHSIGFHEHASTLFNAKTPHDPEVLQVIQFIEQSLDEHDGEVSQSAVLAARCIASLDSARMPFDNFLIAEYACDAINTVADAKSVFDARETFQFDPEVEYVRLLTECIEVAAK